MLKRACKYIGNKPFTVMKNINPQLSHLADHYQEITESNYMLYSGTLHTAIIGLEEMIDIIPELYRETRLKLIIAGDGPYRRQLEEYATAKGITDEVTFLGHIDRDRLYRIIHEAKLCLAPFRKTLQLDVALPNKLFEYMVFGKPVVYPDLPGFREVLGFDNEGRYIPDNKEDLKRVIKNLLSDEELRKSTGKKNRELLKEITFEKEFSNLLDLYHVILKGNKALKRT